MNLQGGLFFVWFRTRFLLLIRTSHNLQAESAIYHCRLSFGTWVHRHNLGQAFSRSSYKKVTTTNPLIAEAVSAAEFHLLIVSRVSIPLSCHTCAIPAENPPVIFYSPNKT